MAFSHRGWHARVRCNRAALVGLLLLSSGLTLKPAVAADTPAAAAPPPAVTVAPVVDQDVTRKIQFVGNIQAIQQLDVKARVEGFLTQVAFDEGAYVKEGQLLYQIDPAPFQASLDAANAELASAKAQLASNQANLTQKQITLDRQLSLVKSGTVSQAVVDSATADRDMASAQVQSAQASIQQAQAQVETAKINLGYTTMTSAISGRIGKTKYTVGNLVNTGSGTLDTVVQMDPIRVVFSIPEKDYVLLTRRIAEGAKTQAQATAVTESGDTDLGNKFTPTLMLPDGSTYDKTGKMEFINNQVDTNTGTVSVFATFSNPDSLLLPGQYVTVTVQEGDVKKVPVISQAAILQDAQGSYVYVVGTDNRAVIRRVTTGTQIGTSIAIQSGLISGEMVIVDGVQKVRPGIVVTPVQQTQSSAADASAATSQSGN